MTPGRYMQHWRMHTARTLLEHSDQSVAAISEAVGYDSEVAFRKAFSSHVGTPPAQYRRQSRPANVELT